MRVAKLQKDLDTHNKDDREKKDMNNAALKLLRQYKTLDAILDKMFGTDVWRRTDVQEDEPETEDDGVDVDKMFSYHRTHSQVQASQEAAASRYAY